MDIALKRLATAFIASAAIFTVSHSVSIAADSSCNPFSVAIATTPAPVSRTYQFNQYRASLRNLSSLREVLVLGDSHIFLWPERAWIKALPNITSARLGVQGERTQNLLYRLDEIQRTNAGGPSPNAVILMIGTNNLLDDEPGCAVAEGIYENAARIREIWPHASLIVVSPPPQGPMLSAFEEKTAEIVEILSVKLPPNTTLVDVSHALDCASTAALESWVRLKDLISRKENQLCSYYEADNTHLTEAGYEVLGKALNAIMKEVKNPDAQGE